MAGPTDYTLGSKAILASTKTNPKQAQLNLQILESCSGRSYSGLSKKQKECLDNLSKMVYNAIATPH